VTGRRRARSPARGDHRGGEVAPGVLVTVSDG